MVPVAGGTLSIGVAQDNVKSSKSTSALST